MRGLWLYIPLLSLQQHLSLPGSGGGSWAVTAKEQQELTPEAAVELALQWVADERTRGDGIQLLLDVVAATASTAGANASFYLGMIAYQLGDREASVPHYAAAVAASPAHADAANNLGNVYSELGRPPAEAEAMYLAALAADPAHRVAHLNLALSAMNRGSGAEARRLFEELRVLYPRDSEVAFNAAFSHERDGNVMDAAAAYEVRRLKRLQVTGKPPPPLEALVSRSAQDILSARSAGV